MSRLKLIIVFTILCFSSNGQVYSFKATNPVVEATMRKAVENAESFIVNTVTPEVFNNHFLLMPFLSTVKSDFASYHYTPYMSDSIKFTPSNYELRYLVKTGSDTLTDSFVIPVDSLGNVDVDTSAFHYIIDDLKAYRRLFTGQYNFDLQDVKQFIRSNSLKGYFIQFRNSIESIQFKEYNRLKKYRHYWFVYRYYPGYEKVYCIDPESGKYILIKRKVQVVQ